MDHLGTTDLKENNPITSTSTEEWDYSAYYVRLQAKNEDDLEESILGLDVPLAPLFSDAENSSIIEYHPDDSPSDAPSLVPLSSSFDCLFYV